MRLTKLATGLLLATSLLSACSENNKQPRSAPTLLAEAKSRLDIYKPVTLSADLSHLSENQKKMIVLLIEASDIIDELFWQQAFGEDKASFLASIDDEKVREFARINYGPWDRLDGDKPFLSGYQAKAAGAEFYPNDLTKAEFEQADFADKSGLYSVVKRTSDGQLTSVAFSELYSDSINRIAAILEKASSFADDKEFANYLNLRATAIRHDDFQASDFAWMDMKNNPIDVVIGPIETYEDQLYGYRAAFESYVLIKDLAWSEKLAKYAEYLPELQKDLPVKKAYKKEVPGSDADLNAYDVIYYAGHSNAGS
ncbi:Zn-dependent hydrolase, partial [Colwellia sp. BRX8-8]|nr:Zn-dependent hydrolase [Colwellia sp. BRX8-8]